MTAVSGDPDGFSAGARRDLAILVGLTVLAILPLFAGRYLDTGGDTRLDSPGDGAGDASKIGGESRACCALPSACSSDGKTISVCDLNARPPPSSPTDALDGANTTDATTSQDSSSDAYVGCCGPTARLPACSTDGTSVVSCMLTNQACGYSYVWDVQPCANGCAAGDGSSLATCR